MQQDEGYFMVSNFAGSNFYTISRYVESNLSPRKISFLMVFLRDFLHKEKNRCLRGHM